MLVISRKIGQQIHIGDQITVTILKSQGQTVRVGIEAPRDVKVLRAELPPLPSELDSSGLPSRPRPRQPQEAMRGVRGPGEFLPTESRSGQHVPGRDAMNGMRRAQPSDPARWTVSSMRQRVQAQTSPRTGSTGGTLCST